MFVYATVGMQTHLTTSPIVTPQRMLHRIYVVRMLLKVVLLCKAE